MNAPSYTRLPAWLVSPWFIALLAVGLYGNTLFNRFALDDGLVLAENAFVQQGVRGIPELLVHDSFYGAIGNSAYLTGGRYRPLSLITYAIEVSLFGVAPMIHHGVNVLLFALNGVVLLHVLRRWVFPRAQWAAWCVAFLFTVHPVHVEVVANIKGRDELLSLLFLLLTIHHALLHAAWSATRSENPTGGPAARKGKRQQGDPLIAGKWSHLWAPLFFSLALLSKENGLSFIVILPMALYFLGGASPWKAVREALPVIMLVMAYVVGRMLLLEARNNTVLEIMDNPYLHADTGEKLGTILYVHLRYLGLLFWPHPLTFDYSFNTIPYRTLADPLVLISAVLHLAFVSFAAYAWRRRDILGFCVILYLCTLGMVNNLLFNVGAPMAERFLYQASVPFLMALVEVIRRLAARQPGFNRMWTYGGVGVLILILGLSTMQVVARNANWRTGDELFLHDVHIVPNSVRAQTFAGIALIHRSDSAATLAQKRELAWAAVHHLKKAEELHPTYLPTLLNLGLAYYRLDSMPLAEACWDKVRAKDPKDPKLLQLEAFLFDRYYRLGVAAGTNGDYTIAIEHMEHALQYGGQNANAWYDLGGICYTAKNYSCARSAWERTLQLAPKHEHANRGMAALIVVERAATAP